MPETRKHRPAKTIFRLGLAIVIGFFLAAIAAAIFEEQGASEITFGSWRMMGLTSIFTVLVWLGLSQRDRRKAQQHS